MKEDLAKFLQDANIGLVRAECSIPLVACDDLWMAPMEVLASKVPLQAASLQDAPAETARSGACSLHLDEIELVGSLRSLHSQVWQPQVQLRCVDMELTCPDYARKTAARCSKKLTAASEAKSEARRPLPW